MSSFNTDSRTRLQATTILTSVIAIMAASQPAYALPAGGNVVAGQAAIASAGTNTDITQASNRALIEWGNFDIGSNESVNFIQPSSASITLNRVVGNLGASQIDGALNANGNVVIVNSQGVMFGAGAQVNVGGIVATTADIDNNRFMAGDLTFDRAGNPDAKIQNDGNIKVAEGGLALFVGPNVINNGLIQATLGKVQLASGETFAVDMYGDGLLSLQASDTLAKQLVKNSGKIEANGGQVLLTAAAAQNAVESVINMDGIVQADSIGSKNGKVVLSGANTTTLVSGTITAKGAGTKGGSVDVLGKNVAILTGATVDASGDTGGGKIRVGGDFHGAGDTPTAENTVMQTGSNLLANATTNGNGGEVAVWADGNTTFAGNIEAKGGSASGNGGFVETSGKEYLGASGSVNASATNGNAGTWLLDPNNITIRSSGSDTNVTGNPNFTTTANSAFVTTGSIQTNLNAGTNVIITTGTGGTNTQDGNITVQDDISKTAGTDASLTLNAHNDITFSSGTNVTSTSGKLNVTLNADKDATGGGAIQMNGNSSIESNGGDITLGGGGSPLTTAAIGHAGQVDGVDINNATLNAAGGNISIRGQGLADTNSDRRGVRIRGGAVVQTSGNGTITVIGQGGGGGNGDDNYGVQINGAGTTISAVNGAISVTGTGGGSNVAASKNNYGIGIVTNTAITSTGSGAINLTGTAGGDQLMVNGNDGIHINGGTNSIGGASATGNITLAMNTLDVSNTLDVRTTGTVTLKPVTPGTTVGIAGAAGGLQITSAILNAITAGKIVVGSSTITGALAANAYTWGANAELLTGSGNIAIDGVQTMGGLTFLANTASGDITIGASGGVTSNASGNAIILAASGGDFFNNAGAGALSTPSGRWLVYSTNPSADTVGGLVSGFKRYSCSYGGSCPTLGSGNGLLYSFTPTLTITPDAASTTYGQAAPAFTYALSGYLAGDSGTDNVTGAPTITTPYAPGSNVGSYDITAAAGALASQMGYGFSGATRTNGLTVDKAALAITASNQSQTYGDGNVFTAGFSTSGLYSTETVGSVSFVTNATNSTSGNWKAGTWNITASNATGGSFNPNNYTITYNNGTLSIAQKSLTVGATANNKVYDGNNTATVTLSDNRITNDVLTASNTGATFSDKNVANGKTVTVSGISISGTDAANYSANSSSTALADITPAALTITASNQSQTYGDGNNLTSGYITSALQGSDVIDTVDLATNAGFTTSNNWQAGSWTITTSNALGSSFDANNYTITYNSGSLSIAQKALTVTTSAQNKVYDATRDATVTLSDNRVTNDVFNDNYTLARFGNKNAGNNKNVTVSGISITGTDAGNYSLTSTTAGTTANITKAALTVTANDQSQTYGAANNLTSGFSSSGLQGGETIGSVDLSTNASLSTGGFWNAKPTWKITASNAGGGTFDTGNYSITYVKGTLNISPKALTVSAVAQDKTYDGTRDATVTLSNDAILGDVVDNDFNNARFGNKNAGTNKTVTVNGISISGADADNYSLTSNTATDTADIFKRALTIAATGIDKVYDGNRDATVTLSDDRVAGDTFNSETYNNARFNNKNVGNGKPINVTGIDISGGDANNYTFNTTATTSANITPAALSVTAGDQSQTYGDGNVFTGGFSSSGLQGSDAIDTVDFVTNAGLSTSNNWTAGSWTITASNALGSSFNPNNYTITYNNGTLSVAQKSLIVTASAQDKVYDANTTATVTLSDDRITNDVLTASNTSADFSDKNVGDDKTVTVLGISISGTDAANYAANTSTTALADITPASLTITASNQSQTYSDGNNLTAGYTTSALQGSDAIDTVDLDTDATDSTSGNWNAGTWTITASNALGAAFDANNYDITYVDGTLSIAQKALAVTASAQDKVYDGTTTASVTLFDDRITNDVLTASNTSADFSDKNVGDDKTVTVLGISISGTDSANYSANTSTTTLADITPATLSVDADDQTKVYGSADPTLTYAFSGFVTGDDSSLFTGGLDRTAGENVVGSPYAINLGTLDAGGNYTIAYTGGGLTITPYTLSIIADDQTKTYGAADPTLTYSFGALQNGDTSSVFTGGLTRDAGEHVAPGPYAINQGSLDAGSNYTIDYTGALLFIDPAALSIVADNKFMSMGGSLPPLTYQLFGLTGGDDGSIVTGALSTVPARSLPGTYPINRGTVAANSDYTVTYTRGFLNIDSPFGGNTSNNTSEQTSNFAGGNFTGSGGTSSLLSVSNGGGSTGGNLGNLSPAAGGENLGDLNPSAGGDTFALIECNDDNPCDNVQ